ncbi:MAG: phosphate acetyltransferase [Venatoribacter sp.]
MINIFIAPTGLESGLTSISLGLIRTLDAQGLKVGFLKPIAPSYAAHERSTQIVRNVLKLQTPDPMHLNVVQQRISDGLMDQVLEDVVALHAVISSDCDVMLIEGLVPDRSEPYTAKLNAAMAKALNAEVVLVTNGCNRNLGQVQNELKVQVSIFGGENASLLGCIINKAGHTHYHSGIPSAETADRQTDPDTLPDFTQLKLRKCPVLGVIPWRSELISPRVLDVARALNTEILSAGEIETRRVMRIALCARSVANTIDSFRPGTLIVVPGDRDDIIIAAAMAASSGVPLAGMLLTGGMKPEENVINLCRSAIQSGAPILQTTLDSLTTAQRLTHMDTQVAVDDPDRVQLIMNTVAEHLNAEVLMQQLGQPHPSRLSPAAFRHLIVQKARNAKKRIVLPEGEEPRTIQAAAICQARGIADCVLIGNPANIRQLAQANEVTLPDGLQLIDPADIRQSYVASMVELRKHKQLTEPMALAQLEDNVVLGTMMVACGDVDGLVSGAIHTTASTIRPAMQLIKTAPNAKLISSVLFMGLPDQVLVYGDCAVNPDPNAEELADIAIQSADSAAALGIQPRIAMLSYSTGKSGTGADVEKVVSATEIVKSLRPDLIVDGPLQYDAATTASVARSKAPNSPVAGQATVLIFPDLNTGNTTYKAVQRSANVVSIGPMLQGLAKPVNDLSRGALIDDIVYTIALTAIQAQQKQTDNP